MNGLVYWTSFQLKEWQVTVAATERGLCYVGLAKESERQLMKWCAKTFGDVEVREQASELARYEERIHAYLSGEEATFHALKVDLYGTPFQLCVWRALQEIAYGQTVSYSTIAKSIGKPSAVRAVASAIGKNPVLLVVPCHRVVGKDGSLTGYRDGIDYKRKLLELEMSE